MKTRKVSSGILKSVLSQTGSQCRKAGTRMMYMQPFCPGNVCSCSIEPAGGGGGSPD